MTVSQNPKKGHDGPVPNWGPLPRIHVPYLNRPYAGRQFVARPSSNPKTYSTQLYSLLSNTRLYCPVLYYTIPYYTILYYTILYLDRSLLQFVGLYRGKFPSQLGALAGRSRIFGDRPCPCIRWGLFGPLRSQLWLIKHMGK